MREQNIAEIKGVALIEMMNKFGDFSSKDGGVVFMFTNGPGLDAWQLIAALSFFLSVIYFAVSKLFLRLFQS